MLRISLWTNKKKLLSKLKIRIDKYSLNDALLSSFKVLLSLSVVGSPISALIDEFIPSQRFLRLEKFVDQLANELNALQSMIDVNSIKTNEFAFMFEQCIRGVLENYDEEKLEAFKWILVNSLIDNNVVQKEKEFFLNITKILTITHIKVLKFLYDPLEYLNLIHVSPNELKGNFKHFLPTVFLNIDYEIMKIAFDDLYKYGLISINSSIFQVITTKSGYARLEETSKLCDFGMKYFNFITNPN